MIKEPAALVPLLVAVLGALPAAVELVMPAFLVLRLVAERLPAVVPVLTGLEGWAASGQNSGLSEPVR